MAMPDDNALRSMLDRNGLLVPGVLPPPPRRTGYTIFAQRSDARLEIETWAQHASRFFEARVGLTVPKVYAGPPPRVDAARIVVAPREGAGASRFCYGRPTTTDDRDAAERAEIAKGAMGLAELARRCPQVWFVATEAREGEDEFALRLAVIVASVVLGPILSPAEDDLFGVRTGREKLGAIVR